MFADVPVIVISSAAAGVGKTTLTLNLAAALWNDKYNVCLFAPDNRHIDLFLKNRQSYMNTNKIVLPMPKLLRQPDEFVPGVNEVVIADISSHENEKYASVFAAAHTLISVARQNDSGWLENRKYMDLIWQAKKQVAARGIKYLNWIVVPNKLNKNSNQSISVLQDQERKFGFRTASGLSDRSEFQCFETGICAADRIAQKCPEMTINDVYARREILQLAGFLWQNKAE